LALAEMTIKKSVLFDDQTAAGMNVIENKRKRSQHEARDPSKGQK